jgi:stress response protein YsnF
VTQGEAGAPAGAFEERTVEVHQTAEEPVVTKTARVAEEVVVRKDVTERTETVRDDVRREQVEVQKDPDRPV